MSDYKLIPHEDFEPIHNCGDEAIREQSSLAAMPGSAASTAEHCPICDWPGIFIRTRYFEAGATADVWMCDNSKCKSYRLYWHENKTPNAPHEPRRE